MEQLEDLCILLHFSFFIYSIMPKKILLVTILITINFHYFFFFMSAVKKSCSKKDNTILYLLCVALAISLIVIACLVYSIKKLKKSSYVYSNGKQSHSHHIKQSILGKYNLILLLFFLWQYRCSCPANKCNFKWWPGKSAGNYKDKQSHKLPACLPV